MCCCNNEDDLECLPVNSDGLVELPKNHGCCRDCYCLIVFILAIIGMIVIFVIGFTFGEPKKLYYPLNKNGYYCGMKSSVNKEERDYTNFPYFLYYDVSDLSQGICVSECPTPDKFCIYTNGTVFKAEKTACFGEGIIYESGDKIINDTIELVRRCIPNIEEILEKIKSMSEEFADIQNLYSTFISDIRNGYPLLLISVGITLIFSFLVFVFLQCCAKCVVWCILILAILLFLIIGIISLYYGIKYYRNILVSDKTSSTILIIFAICVLVIALFVLLIAMGLRKRISFAAIIIHESSRTIRYNCCIMVVPVVYALLFLIGVVLLIITMVYYFSSLEIDTTNGEHNIIFKKETRSVCLFTLLVFIWWTFFSIGMNQYTIGSVGAEFYFSRPTKERERKSFPVLNAVKTLFLHHLGSIALGSFLIALVCTFRSVLLYLAKKVKEQKSEALGVLLACLQCLFGVIQRLLEFIASRAYIMMAIRGKNFLSSAMDALKLMINNPTRSFFLTGISKFIIILGELMVVGLSVLVCFFVLRPDALSDGVESYFKVVFWWFLLFLCFFVSFFVSVIVFAVYEYLTDSIFLCFLQDEQMEMSLGDKYKVYARKRLREYMDVDKFDKDSEENKNNENSIHSNNLESSKI